MYLDTAIIIKLLVREAESAWFNRALSDVAFETSELAIAEVRSALLAKERAGHIHFSERVKAENKFLQMLESQTIKLHSLNRAVLERAGAIQIACHPHIPLRTLDALHVATCDLHRSGTLATTDGRMRAACQQFAIALIPENLENLTTDR
jgi:predicted nucleic acid-binding protein